MRYQINHTTIYTYSQPVILQPHRLRLRPRCDGDQSLEQFQIQVMPLPLGTTQILDPEGNAIARYWWAETPTQQLSFQVQSQVTTHCTNPFSFVLEPWAIHLPFNYPAAVLHGLQPYLQDSFLGGIGLDPIATQLGLEIAHTTGGNPIMFLSELNQRIYKTCQHQIRETGTPFPPSITWSRQSGSCRDLTVLFMSACRAVGLAARFVSGYQEGDADAEQFHLHAWAEVYLPGAGWRGYDPTQGLAVSDRHIPLVASAWPGNAAPVTGTIQGKGATSSMTYQLSIQTISGSG
jgi:transglutaminase-like putative cysteine protease